MFAGLHSNHGGVQSVKVMVLYVNVRGEMNGVQNSSCYSLHNLIENLTEAAGCCVGWFRVLRHIVLPHK